VTPRDPTSSSCHPIYASGEGNKQLGEIALLVVLKYMQLQYLCPSQRSYPGSSCSCAILNVHVATCEHAEHTSKKHHCQERFPFGPCKIRHDYPWTASVIQG
jgi:hypothetical protein